MRTFRKFFTGLFNINTGTKTKKDKYIPTKKESEPEPKMRIRRKWKMMRKRIYHNARCSYAKTKGLSNLK